MATAARTSTAPDSSPALVSADHVYDLIEEHAALDRDLTSARMRARTMFRALNDRAGRTVAVVGVFGRGDTVDRIVRAAQIAEALGHVPAIRFIRTAAGEINGIELALLERDEPANPDAGHDEGFRMLAQMAVSAGGES